MSSLAGVLHAYVAFDWGDAVDLEKARLLVPTEVHALPRRRRTPPSISFRPPPLRFELPPVPLCLPELGPAQTRAEAAVFDFAGVSVALHLPFDLPLEKLIGVSASLADPGEVIHAAADALAPLYRQLQPAVENPGWRTHLSEEYFVFQIMPADGPSPLLQPKHAKRLAGLLRQESSPLSDEEAAEALRFQLSYSPSDFFLPDWAAAVLIDRDCDETLQTIELSNVQLLEYRYIDNRLDDILTEAHRLIDRLSKRWLPTMRTHAAPLRRLGELRVEANELFERTGNVLKLVGDQYLARVYRQLASRLHLGQWEQSIQRKLDVLEGVYQILSDESSNRRMEFLELVIILLILFEVVMAFTPWRQ